MSEELNEERLEPLSNEESIAATVEEPAIAPASVAAESDADSGSGDERNRQVRQWQSQSYKEQSESIWPGRGQHILAQVSLPPRPRSIQILFATHPETVFGFVDSLMRKQLLSIKRTSRRLRSTLCAMATFQDAKHSGERATQTRHASSKLTKSNSSACRE